MRPFTRVWIQPVVTLVTFHCTLTVFVWTWIMCQVSVTTALRRSPIRLDGRFVIKDYEIVYPVYVGSGETAVRADFSQGRDPHHGQGRDPRHGRRRRQRRNAREQTTDYPNFQSTSQLNISGLGQNFIVKLESNEDLLAPGFQVYFRGNGSVLSRTWPYNTDSERMPPGRRGDRDIPIGGDCLFRGDIVSHPSARAAFSMCRGQMFGLLMTHEDDFVIEPVPARQRGHAHSFNRGSAPQARPHLMYRASNLRQRERHYEGLKASLHHPARSHRTAGLEWPFDRRRRKRSAYKLSRGLTAEVLVVADKSMYYAHKADDVIMYILSIMNIVSQLYKESSLGTTIKITLVGLVIMQTDEPKLTINHHAGQTLQNFCQWQAGVTGTYGKHDHAVLITALDICSHKNQPCDTLGYAPIEGMCDSSRSCSINEDTGLATGYTVAHEMGHNLGMYHDGGKDMCPHASGTIMSPKLTVGGEGEIFKWSSCSRNYLIKFLHTQQAKCLWKNSLQVSRLRFPQKLPGEIYSANQQCAWLFGKGSTRCKYEIGKNLCKHLWCESEGHLCQTKYLPAADGTTCDTGKWCVQGRCVLSGRSVQDAPVAMVNGAWSEWGAWSDCSRSCGGGVRQRERRCDNPRPMYGGEPCEGISRSYRICHTQECENREEEFRADQCRRYERQPFHGSYYKWRPYNTITQANDQCKLYCQALGYDFITALSNQVQDGTPCSPHSSDVCVEGSCKSYGCDMIIDSEAKEDNCGVCRGDNSTCRVVKGEFRLQPRLRVYFPITVIPKQARHIHIKEKSVSHNYLAIRDIYGNYYLNGNKNVEVPGVYILGGARFEYRRSQNKQESLVSVGPLQQDIVLEVLVIGRNPGILYDYTLPTLRSPLPENYDTPIPTRNQNNKPRPSNNNNYDPPRRYHPNQYDYQPPRTTPPRHYYRWRTVEQNCSETCGGGELTQLAECWMDGRYHVNPALCDPQRRPFDGKTACNTQACDPRWVSYEWRACSRSCGGGKQVRKIRCRQRLSRKVDRRVDKRLCSRLPKPSRRQWCNTEDCPATWALDKWTTCSVTCGRGVQSRNQTCSKQTFYGLTPLPDSACQHLPRHAPTHRACQLAECPVDLYQWVVSSWSKCSTTCGLGVKTRALRCSYVADGDRGRHSVDSHYCARLPQPLHIPLQEVCTNSACSPQHWHTSAWTKCSVSCGSGRRTRSVYCRDMRTGRRSAGCDWRSKPHDTEPCDGGHCPLAVPYHCVDQFSWCGLVPKHNVCRHNFYGTRCCHSCRVRRSLGR